MDAIDDHPSSDIVGGFYGDRAVSGGYHRLYGGMQLPLHYYKNK